MKGGVEYRVVAAMIRGTRGIGIDGRLPWPRIRTDMRRFRELTLGYPMIVGRVTFEGIGALEGRLNIVLSTHPRRVATGGKGNVELAKSLLDADRIVKKHGYTVANIIGGGDVFSAAFADPRWSQRLFLTEVEQQLPCDRYFPPIPPHYFKVFVCLCGEKMEQSSNGHGSEGNGGGMDENEELDPSRYEVIEMGEGDGVDDGHEMDEEGDHDGGDFVGNEEDEVADGGGEPVEVDDTFQDLFGHTDSVFCVAASPTDNNLVASGGGDDRGVLIDVRNNKVVASVENAGDSIGAVAFSADGTLVAFGALNGRVFVMEVSSGKVLYEPEGPSGSIEWLKWHPKGPFLLAGCEDNMLWMWNQKGAVDKCFVGHGGTVSCGGFTPSGRGIVSGSADGTVRVWNPRDGTCIATTAPLVHEDPPAVLSMDLSDPEGGSNPLAVVGYANGAVVIINASTGVILSALPSHNGTVETVAFSPPDTVPKMCASGGMDGVLRVWDIDLAKVRCDFLQEEGVVACLWHPKKQGLLISAGADRTVRVWDAKKAIQLAVLQGNRDTILSMDIGATGEYVVTGGDDHSVRIFSLYQQ